MIQVQLDFRIAGYMYSATIKALYVQKNVHVNMAKLHRKNSFY